jgi:DNA (cytosine-5)-methyltransferase 1
MIAATLFSGIGAPECAMPHWRWAWSAEIEKFPSAVLAARHPQSINLGDVTAHDFADRAAAIARPDVVVFGSPCQSYSIAGKRLGLDDPRGNLALVALGIIARLEPRWFVFENVPGLLSSFSGAEHAASAVREGACGQCRDGEESRDVAAFVSRFHELGYSGAWASLDSQYFGVAQRRERVFAVGHLGDWRYPAAVLLEPESLCGDSPPRRQTRQDVAGAIGAGSRRSGGRLGRRKAAAGHVIPTMEATAGRSGGADTPIGSIVANTPRGEGFDAGGDPYGAIIPICESGKRANVKDSPKNGMGIGREGDPMFTIGVDSRDAVAIAPTLQSNGKAAGSATQQDAENGMLIAFDTTQITSKDNRCQPQPGAPCHPLASQAHPPAIAFQCHGSNVGEMGTLRKGDGGVTSGVPFVAECADTLTAFWERSKGASAGNNHGVIYPSAGVRRLMPVECERLQAFPDGYTAITYRGKPAADGPRYKSLGNSMSVTVIRWILQRIKFVDALLEAHP